MMHRSCRCCQHDISTKRAPMIMLVRRKNLVGRENACYEVKLAAAPAGTEKETNRLKEPWVSHTKGEASSWAPGLVLSQYLVKASCRARSDQDSVRAAGAASSLELSLIRNTGSKRYGGIRG
eukprot:744898-Pelagomonas_calceolata.AAC.1